MDKIAWCMKKRDGIRLMEPNANLSEAYIRKAEDSLEAMRSATVRDWKISAAYYAMYFSLYAILARIGVRCEIHSCTLEFARRFLGEHFSEAEVEFLEDSLKARIDAQYYVNRQVPDRQCADMIKRAPEFLVKSKSVLMGMPEKKAGEIRNSVRKSA